MSRTLYEDENVKVRTYYGGEADGQTITIFLKRKDMTGKVKYLLETQKGK